MKSLAGRRFIHLINQNTKLKARIVALEFKYQKSEDCKDILTVEEVLKEFKMSRSTFDRYVKKGLKINQPCRNGKIYVNRFEIENFLIKNSYGRFN